MYYIHRHWQGKLPLALSFWGNFVLLGLVLHLLERFVFPPYIEGELAVTTAVVVFFVIVRLLIYPWQVVGVFRACESYIKNLGDRSWALAAQLTVVASFVFVLSAAFSTYQNLMAYRQSFLIVDNAPAEKLYSLELTKNKTLIHLTGPLQIGITHDVEALLAQTPTVTGIILDSDGGRIYEGRGLAKLIRENQLDTYSSEICSSACTTAFISGGKRILSADARLGFHQYKTYSVHPNLDLQIEQEKDKALFRKQEVDEDFLAKIFDKPFEDMWWPAHEELIKAGVIHKIGAIR